MWRVLGPGLTVAGLLIAAGMYLFGDFTFASLDPPERDLVAAGGLTAGGLTAGNLTAGGLASNASAAGDDAVQTFAGDLGRHSSVRQTGLQTVAGKSPKRPATIRIATFNIKQFGPKKAADPQVMRHIATLISRFDVVAIQEVHGAEAEPIRALVQELRRGGASYAGTVSERIGAGQRYSESYAFVWNRRTVEMIAGSDYLVADPGGRMARQPMACSFRCRGSIDDNRQPFSFTLINVHTSPSQVADNALLNEMDVLDDVYLSIAEYSAATLAEDDIILLGDLNVDADHLRQLGQIPNLRSIGGLTPTNLKGTKVYDHILINAGPTAEHTGNSGVVDVTGVLSIDMQIAETISDHRPVWAEFQTTEAGQRTASTTRIIR